MITHVVLFRPKSALAPAQREQLATVMRTALQAIPSIRRARVGRRLTHGRAYEGLMAADYPYAVLLDFDDLAGLQAYLEHPAHDQLAARFFDAFEAALIYDYELFDGDAGVTRLM